MNMNISGSRDEKSLASAMASLGKRSHEAISLNGGPYGGALTNAQGSAAADATAAFGGDGAPPSKMAKTGDNSVPMSLPSAASASASAAMNGLYAASMMSSAMVNSASVPPIPPTGASLQLSHVHGALLNPNVDMTAAGNMNVNVAMPGQAPPLPFAASLAGMGMSSSSLASFSATANALAAANANVNINASSTNANTNTNSATNTNTNTTAESIPRELLPAPYFYYRDNSHNPDDDPLTPLTPLARVPNFPAKMHAILSRPDLADVVTWMPHGRSWRVLKPREFEIRVIPTYFEHSKFSSFIRQANGWGFRRITRGKDRNSYYHELFLRGLPHLCKKMRRPTVSKKAEVENEPDLYAISAEHPLPEKADADYNILLPATLVGGPKARMPVGVNGVAVPSDIASAMNYMPGRSAHLNGNDNMHASANGNMNMGMHQMVHMNVAPDSKLPHNPYAQAQQITPNHAAVALNSNANMNANSSVAQNSPVMDMTQAQAQAQSQAQAQAQAQIQSLNTGAHGSGPTSLVPLASMTDHQQRQQQQQQSQIQGQLQQQWQQHQQPQQHTQQTQPTQTQLQTQQQQQMKVQVQPLAQQQSQNQQQQQQQQTHMFQANAFQQAMMAAAAAAMGNDPTSQFAAGFAAATALNNPQFQIAFNQALNDPNARNASTAAPAPAVSSQGQVQNQGSCPNPNTILNASSVMTAVNMMGQNSAHCHSNSLNQQVSVSNTGMPIASRNNLADQSSLNLNQKN